MKGTRLSHYTLLDKLGHGGMGEVYAGTDTKLSREVAIKLLPESLTDAERKGRFLQEAQMAARLNHPAITQVYDLGEDQGKCFIVMERIQGQTITELLAKKELDLLGAIDIAIQVADGLFKAHEAGIMHRDIKSSNVMLTADGHVKILDFGLAKLLESPDESGISSSQSTIKLTSNLTQMGAVMGTVNYMSPEQARGGKVDFRSDLFSLGVMLFEMVTGRQPFCRANHVDTLHAISFDDPPAIRTIKPNVPEEIQEIVSKCLRKRPEDRYSNAAFLAHDLRSAKRNILTGRTSRMSISKWVSEEWEALRQIKGGEYMVYASVALLVALFIYLSKIEVGLGSIVFFSFVYLFLFRYIRHQPQRTIEKFARFVSRIPEVMLLRVYEEEVTIVMDQTTSRLYDRINNYLNRSNRRLFFGKPLKMRLIQKNDAIDFQTILQLPGVRYVRQDVLDEKV